ncbi:hypothetical protein GQ53DRAFT_188086 [Thozetella sp. PMI_491]|nr:hypothetical protein GQ53DRAFT_188086 [Thozetella sp. PMI_491]
MRFTPTLLAALAVGANSLGLWGADDQSIILDDELDVPGKSPLKFCEAARSDDLIEIKSVDLSPNPPEAGQELIITATGKVKEQIEQGSFVNLQVKYGYIRLVNMKADLCDQIGNVDLECPIKEGILTITKSVELPKEIPPGKYTVHADVYTEDERRITCLDAVVTFGKKDSLSLDL